MPRSMATCSGTLAHTQGKGSFAGLPEASRVEQLIPVPHDGSASPAAMRWKHEPKQDSGTRYCPGDWPPFPTAKRP